MKNIAPVSMRIFSAVIDFTLYILFYLILLLPIVSADTISGIMDNFTFLIFSLIIIYPVLIPLFSIVIISVFGGTIGKLATGLMIVDKNDNKISLFKAFMRNYVGYIASSMLFWLGFIWIVRDINRQGWHDMIAGTYVIRKKGSGIIMGVLILSAVIFLNFILTLTILQKISLNSKLYLDIFSDVFNKLNETQKKNDSNDIKYDVKINNSNSYKY
jgi:uncharacterized RDD family membrane protein YckC